MILPYTLRLICLCFATFFVVHTVLAAVAWGIAPKAISAGVGMRPRSGARFLLALRLLPGALAAFVVTAFCVPSYLWLETNESTERVGLACCAMAVLGVLICVGSVMRSAWATFLSWREAKRCKIAGVTGLATHALPVTVLNSDVPVLALAGLIRPRVIVSHSILHSLSPEELDAAIAHERAHRRARDNWKRLALAFAPEILPFSRLFAKLNQCWAKLIEWAADDDATADNFARSLSLAAALVQVARMRGASLASPLMSFFVGNNRDLSVRVERLLGPRHREGTFPRRLRITLTIAAAALGTLALIAVFHPATLSSVHEILELLVR